MKQSSSLTESIAALTPSQHEQVEYLLQALRSETRDQDVLFPSAGLSDAALAAIWGNPEDDVYDAL